MCLVHSGADRKGNCARTRECRFRNLAFELEVEHVGKGGAGGSCSHLGLGVKPQSK